MQSCSNPEQQMQDQQISSFLSGVKYKLLVMSGKGGVGKSTVAANIALVLCNQGFKVGLMDIDLHGPSIAGLFGLKGLPLNVIDGKIHPFVVHENLKIVSMQGFLNNPDDSFICRGPAKIGIIRQLLANVDWGAIDFLIVDSPPGTGDEPLTIAQTIPGCQAVIVTTPQEIALADVRKSLHFCRQVGLSILGIIENMSGFVCPDCGSIHNIFKTGGGEETAYDWGVRFLGVIPIDPGVVEAGDQGCGLEGASDKTKKCLNGITSRIAENLGAKN